MSFDTFSSEKEKIPPWDIVQKFGMDGPLAAAMPGYTPRPEQIAVSVTVQQAMQQARVCVAEAGTGVGKSWAYLIPAVEMALQGMRTVISTHTIALQSQLMKKDIPFVLSTLNAQASVRAMLLKGRRNFLCHMELDRARGELFAETDPEFQRVLAWADDLFCDGDVESLGFAYERWHDLTSTAESCTHKKCPFYDRCYYYEARKEAAVSQILVVNHALLLVDIALKAKDPMISLLPEYDHLIIDEAHHLESVATEAFGVEFTNKRIPSRVKAMQKASFWRIDGKQLEKVEEANTRLFAPFESLQKQEIGLDDLLKPQERQEVETVAADIIHTLENINGSLNDEKALTLNSFSDPVQRAKAEHELTKIVRSNARICDELKVIFHSALIQEEYVSWIAKEEMRRTKDFRLVLYSAPLYVGCLLASFLWIPLKCKGGSATLMSATLSTHSADGDHFSYLRQRLGFSSDAIELIVGSPFDYKEQAMLYVPGTLPPPPKEANFAYYERLANEISRILAVTHGRAFVLFTSWRAMNEVSAMLTGIPFPIFKQGDKPVRTLIEEFKAAGDGVLFGTASFWEGVDVPGDALSCVIIDRIPFAVPDSPLTSARMKKIEQNGGNSFRDYSIPQAQIKLKQGFGRLIRTKDDFGMVVILDSRLISKPYGNRFVKALPPASRASKWNRVETFWKKEEPHSVNAE